MVHRNIKTHNIGIKEITVSNDQTSYREHEGKEKKPTKDAQSNRSSKELKAKITRSGNE